MIKQHFPHKLKLSHTPSLLHRTLKVSIIHAIVNFKEQIAVSHARTVLGDVIRVLGSVGAFFRRRKGVKSSLPVILPIVAIHCWNKEGQAKNCKLHTALENRGKKS